MGNIGSSLNDYLIRGNKLYQIEQFMMVYVSDAWLSFNGPAIGVLIIGEVVWWRIRKKLIKKWEED